MNRVAKYLWLFLQIGLGWVTYGADGKVLKADASNELFTGTNLVQLDIHLSNAAWAQISSGRGHPKPTAEATVREGMRRYTNVAIQLKGFSSYQSLEGLPSLTLDFSEHVTGQRFHGLKKISLNSSIQDPSRFHEKLAREFYGRAGVPVPRSGHALVTLNGRPLGLYVLTEDYDRVFLKRHFEDASGSFYEGGTLRDIPSGLQAKGSTSENPVDLMPLIRATRESDPERRFAAVSAVLDIDRFNALIAVDAILCNSDSYSMNRNNYRLYKDPKSGRWVFLPHGADRILGSHRSLLDLPVVPPVKGIVARAVLSTPEGRRRYVATAERIFTNHFDSARLCNQVRSWDQVLRPARLKFPRERWDHLGETAQDDATELCARIEKRATELHLQFQQRSNLLTLTPAAVFTAAGVAEPQPWHVRWMVGRPRAHSWTTNSEGRTWMVLRSEGDSLNTTIYFRWMLPAGNYRFEGRLRQEFRGDTGPDVPSTIPLSIVRHHASDRFTTEKHRIHSAAASETGYRFSCATVEEVEVVGQVTSPRREVWIDTSKLRLSKQ